MDLDDDYEIDESLLPSPPPPPPAAVSGPSIPESPALGDDEDDADSIFPSPTPQPRASEASQTSQGGERNRATAEGDKNRPPPSKGTNRPVQPASKPPTSSLANTKSTASSVTGPTFRVSPLTAGAARFAFRRTSQAETPASGTSNHQPSIVEDIGDDSPAPVALSSGADRLGSGGQRTHADRRSHGPRSAEPTRILDRSRILHTPLSNASNVQKSPTSAAGVLLNLDRLAHWSTLVGTSQGPKRPVHHPAPSIPPPLETQLSRQVLVSHRPTPPPSARSSGGVGPEAPSMGTLAPDPIHLDKRRKVSWGPVKGWTSPFVGTGDGDPGSASILDDDHDVEMDIGPGPGDETGITSTRRTFGSATRARWPSDGGFSDPEADENENISDEERDTGASGFIGVASEDSGGRNSGGMDSLAKFRDGSVRIVGDENAEGQEEGLYLGGDGIVMAVSHRRDALGCAYYDPLSRKVYLMDQANVGSGPQAAVEIVRTLKFQLHPQRILGCLRSSDAVLSALKEIASEFSPATGRSRLLSLPLRGSKKAWDELELQGGERTAKFLRLGAGVDVEGGETLACAAALLSDVQKLAPLGGRAGGQHRGGVRSHQDIASNMDEDDDGTNGVDAANSLGRESTVIAVEGFAMELQGRHDAVEAFGRTENLNVVEMLIRVVAKIGNVGVRTNLTPKDWEHLLSFTYSAIEVQSKCRELHIPPTRRIPILDRLAREIDVSALREVGSFVNEVVDFEESTTEGRVSIKRGLDEELDELKRRYEGMGSLLASGMFHLSIHHLGLKTIEIKQLGYLIAAPKPPGHNEIREIEGLSFQFVTEASIYYKNDQMRQMDQEWGDIHSLIVDSEIEWVQRLTDRVLENSEAIVTAANCIGELDCLLALSDASRKYNYKRPQMTEENIIKISNGRHPLQELCVDVFVANGTRMGLDHGDTENFSQVLILSGANYSGKSVYLKQVALIVYMAHVGVFVPADFATIGITDRILTRLQTRDSVSKIQSTFMSDLQQVSFALKNSTARSLIIFDEFGKGTATTDGVGLFCGVVQSLLDRGPECPKVLLATHFHEIFSNSLLRNDSRIGAYTMEIVEDQSNDITFMYRWVQGSKEHHYVLLYFYLTLNFRLVPGHASSSFGAFCARLAGLPERLVARGSEVSKALAQFDPIPVPVTGKDKAKDLAAEKLAVKFLDMDLARGVLDDCWVEVEKFARL
ncbi:MutS protein msh5 [Gonapodya sp. JEL0774]|nr:MutS protein msh5 [Gonapodya sp. JEL0774]